MAQDQSIFDQLDVLERARIESRPMRNDDPNKAAEHMGYDEYGAGFDQTAYRAVLAGEYDEFADQPMVLDSFDEQLLRQPDHDSRHGRAALGRARLSLPSSTFHAGRRDRPVEADFAAAMPPTRQDPPSSRRLDLSRFAFGSGPSGPSSPSPFDLPSSPAFRASQRRPRPAAGGRNETAFPVRGQVELAEQPSGYHPVLASDIEHEEEEYGQTSPLAPTTDFRPNYDTVQPVSKPSLPSSSAPVVQGISLVSTRTLPDRFRTIFPYPLFNAIQSKSFDTIYKTSDNFVLSAPTGSGKTAVLELAICRLVNGFASGSFKIVYQAPTKSLCSERQRDWQAKFAHLDLQCAALTGDTDNAQLQNVQHATIIITTPEKWDSVTRKWKDHQKLMQMVKLFMIDEVHILKEDRGATLEAVVSRMKSIESDVRFIALSATVPNSDDIATWLGKDPANVHLPAARERFGEDFRPVQLRKNVCGYQASSNDFAFEKMLNSKLPEVISKFSQRKPIMVFCFTRNSCVETARLLANWWATKGPRDRYWSGPRRCLEVVDKDLRDTISSGVAFHHAGLSIQERNTIEKAYLEGEINVICCTSTLAVGVNLPCHMVIIKSTVSYHSKGGGCREYSDLEIMQMLGRAGRPQFDDSAIAVIMTRLQRVQYYEKMITGHEVLESCLHRNLIDHLNAEISLGTVTSASSAKKWLSGTFLYVRLKANPEHYKIDGDASGHNLDDRLEKLCSKAIAMLEESELVSATPNVRCTEFGDAMARYYLQFDTMKVFLALPPRSRISEVLSAISQAAEFKNIRFRGGEKATYGNLNKNGSIKFPIPGTLDLSAHKVSLIVQSVLGAVDLPTEDFKQRAEYNSAKHTIFQHASRLVRCIIDCKLYLEDAITTRNALMLARSLGAEVWDDSPLHLKQLEGVGLVYVRKLVAAGIKSIEDLENTEPHRIEVALSRNPPFGTQLQHRASAFPRLRVSLKMAGEPVVRSGEYVTVKVIAEMGLLNDQVPAVTKRNTIYVCFLAEVSDGKKAHFARISAKKLDKGQELLFSVNLTNANQSIRAYVMCDEIAGTMRRAALKPELPPNAFPPPKPSEDLEQQSLPVSKTPNTSKGRKSANEALVAIDNGSDEFGDGGIEDVDLTNADPDGFVDINDFDDARKDQLKPKKRKLNTPAGRDSIRQQLPTGKWACNHSCKDKTACKHMCCREGLDKPRKRPKPKDSSQEPAPTSDPKQTQLRISVTKQRDLLPATQHVRTPLAPTSRKKSESKERQDLDRLHASIVTKTPRVPVLARDRPAHGEERLSTAGNKVHFPVLQAARRSPSKENETDFGTDVFSSKELSPSSKQFVRPRVGASVEKERVGQNSEDMLDVLLSGGTFREQHGPLAGEAIDHTAGLSGGREDPYYPFDDDQFLDFGLHIPSKQCDAGDFGPGRQDGTTGILSEGGADRQATSDCNIGMPAKCENATSVPEIEPTPSKFFTQSSSQMNPAETRLARKHEEPGQEEHDKTAIGFDRHISIAADGQRSEDEEQADELQRWVEDLLGNEMFTFT